jgi:serine/threonine-protein kinase
MSCDRLHAFVDGELDASDAEAFRAHLAGCGDCQSELPRIAALVALVEAASDKRRVSSSGGVLTERPRPAVDLERPEPGHGRLTGRRRADRRGYRVVDRLGAGGMGAVYAAKHMLFGQYRVVDCLGEGGMGVVYAALHTLLDRPAAVKVLHARLLVDNETVTRFFNEARAAAVIRHPGVVEIYEFGRTDDGAAFIVMELLQGETLRARIDRGPMTWGTALGLVRQIACALGAAHAKGIVHRDLKPDNIFLVPDPEVVGGERIKLLDFGIAKLAGSSAGQNRTRTGAVIGTPTYMAPEQCRGVAVDARADLYSLGCILFELCAGRPPFGSQATGDMVAAHIQEPPPAISSLVNGVPQELDALAQRMLAKVPADRVQTTDELIRLINTAKSAISQIARAGSHPALAPAGSLLDIPASTDHDGPGGGEVAPTTTLSSAASAQETTTRAPARRLMLGGLGGLVVLGALALLFAVCLGGGDEAPVRAVAPPPSGSLATSPAPPEPSNASDSATPSRPALKNGVKAPASPPRWRATQVAISIVSVPSGAGVYLGTYFFGNTPLVMKLDRGEYEYDLELRLTGYLSHKLLVRPTKDVQIRVELKRSPPSPPSAQRPKPAPAPSTAPSR